MQIEYLLNQINSIIDSFVKTIDEDYSSQIGSDFEALLDDEIIEWTPICSENSAITFYNDFVSRYPQAKTFTVFTLSILHEVGHLETKDEMVNDIEERNTITDCQEYYNLFNERIATDWAGWWLVTNYCQVKALDDTIEKLFRKLINTLDN